MQPQEVLELLKARLALDDRSDQLALVGILSHESTTTTAAVWNPVSGDPGRTPSYPDITPSPIVIGIKSSKLGGQVTIDANLSDSESPEAWREPAAKDTPAEPIASVRVRQASRPGNASMHLPADTNATRSITERDMAPNHESKVGRLYFPPMKPPESWQDTRTNEPLVHVVPDCDAKTRTERSLRRPSSPTGSFRLLGKSRARLGLGLSRCGFSHRCDSWNCWYNID